MRVASLISGGKDSLYSTYIAIQYGWEITHAVTIKPRRLSWMYHTENVHLANFIAGSMGIPLVERHTDAEKEDELDELESALRSIDIDGVISGAIASEYQRTRIERVCHRLGIKSFTPLWHKNGDTLLKEMVDAEFKTMIVAVAAEGLGEEWLGREIDMDCIKELEKVREKYGINISGEGGEYETFVLDCPLYSKKLAIDEVEKEWDGGRGVLNIKSIVMENK